LNHEVLKKMATYLGATIVKPDESQIVFVSVNSLQKMKNEKEEELQGKMFLSVRFLLSLLFKKNSILLTNLKFRSTPN